MIYLLGSILASTLIFFIFRLYPRFGVDTLQAIVFNYFTAFILGISLYGSEFSQEARNDLSWLPLTLICGVLFISLFLVMGISSQRNGVGLTSVAVKMSMSFSMMLVVISNHESLGFLKIIGMVLAVGSVLLMSISPGTKRDQKPVVWMLIVLFAGSGLLEFGLNYAQNNVLRNLPNSLFSAFGFGIAGCLGMSILLVDYLQGKRKFALRNVTAGLVLGIPNYFSIFLLLKSYEQLDWSDSGVLAVTNISIVTLSSIGGMVFFSEKPSVLRISGLIAAIGSILLLTSLS